MEGCVLGLLDVDLVALSYLRWRLGPFFVAFPNLKHALENNIAIKTQARSCTILPNFIGYASSL